MSSLPPPERTFAGGLEALLELSGSALAAGGLMTLMQNLPVLGRPFLHLPAGFSSRDTPAFILAVALGIVLGPMLLRRLLGGWPPVRLGGRSLVPARDSLLAGLLVAAALTLWSRLLMWVDPEILMPAWRSFGVTRTAEMWAAVLYVSPLAAALPEEIFFRGYAQGTLMTRLGRPWALLLIATVFSLAHAGQGPASVLLAIFPAALALGMLYDRTGSILAPLVAHVTVNTLAFLQFGCTAFYPRWGTTVITAITLACIALLVAARHRLPAAVTCGRLLAADLRRDRAGLWLALATVPVAAATVVITLGLVAPLAGGSAGSPLPLLAAAGLLWGAALGLHRRRGAPWGADGAAPPDATSAAGLPPLS